VIGKREERGERGRKKVARIQVGDQIERGSEKGKKRVCKNIKRKCQ